MKVGDLVVPTHKFDPRRDDGYLGVIVGYDLDNDPVVMWNKYDPGEIDERWAVSYALPEYRSSVEVVSESR
jgi:hypothetical protein